MNRRQRKTPLPLKKLVSVIPRLSRQFQQLPNVNKEAAQRHKGYTGEKKVDYYLDQLPRKYTVLHDVCLELHGYTLQTDSLIITDHAIYSIESKNFTGTITFNTILKQFTRNDGKKEEGFSYPITQAENTKHKLINWLHDHHIHDIPVHFIIAISEPSTIINVIGNVEEIARVVAHAEHVPKKIMDMNEKLAKGGNHRGWRSRQIGEMIRRESKDFDFDILSQFGVKRNDILTGVHCPSCRELPMRREYSTWTCSHCHYRSKKAHLPALSDYQLLISPWITNKECRRFLNINCRSLATRLLRSANLTYHSRRRRWER